MAAGKNPTCYPQRRARQDPACTFFALADVGGHPINGEADRISTTGNPGLESAIAHVECGLVHAYAAGGHVVCVGEVVDAGGHDIPAGRLDNAGLTPADRC